MKMLEFLYTDIVTDIPPDVAVPLLIASEQYLLDRLKGLCEDAIRKVRQPPTTHQKYTDSTLRHTYPYNAQMLTHPHPRTPAPPHPHTPTPSHLQGHHRRERYTYFPRRAPSPRGGPQGDMPRVFARGT